MPCIVIFLIELSLLLFFAKSNTLYCNQQFHYISWRFSLFMFSLQISSFLACFTDFLEVSFYHFHKATPLFFIGSIISLLGFLKQLCLIFRLCICCKCILNGLNYPIYIEQKVLDSNLNMDTLNQQRFKKHMLKLPLSNLSGWRTI